MQESVSKIFFLWSEYKNLSPRVILYEALEGQRKEKKLINISIYDNCKARHPS